MSVGQVLVWIVGPLVLFAAAGTSVVPRLPHLVRTGIVAVVVIVPLVAVLFDVRVAAPDPSWSTLAAFGTAACAVLAGSTVTTTVLRFADRPRPRATTEDDDRALVASLRGDGADAGARQLRGGAAIGYLERLVIVGAVLLGRFEVVAAVVAVKGLGRFSELQSAELRERFIVGTLASGTWAGLCGLLIVLPG